MNTVCQMRFVIRTDRESVVFIEGRRLPWLRTGKRSEVKQLLREKYANWPKDDLLIDLRQPGPISRSLMTRFDTFSAADTEPSQRDLGDVA